MLKGSVAGHRGGLNHLPSAEQRFEAAPLASGDQQRVQFEEVSALAQPLVRLVSGN
jgi:hypothetical protein